MTAENRVSQRLALGEYDRELEADVLVIGGSLAGTWAAIAAAREGATVVIADKGYVGASGPIAAGSVGAYFAKPDDDIQNDVMVNARMPLAFGLADSRWGKKILEQTYWALEWSAQWGFEWPKVKDGREYRGQITPNYLAFLREQVIKHGVTVLDNSPALELLKADEVVAGAAGVARRTGETWVVRAGAVVVATGGTGFLAGSSGAGTNTGDGYLLAAEAGAQFSGMEFSGQFHIKPHGSPSSKGAYRSAGVLTDNNGNVVNLGRQLAQAIVETGAAYDKWEDLPDEELKDLLIKTPYVCTQYFEDAGIDPFKEKYEVDWICEGTMRATGGIEVNDDLQTNVPGLFASGDVASREKVNGAGPPGGGPAAGWAIGAGFFSGQAAARFALVNGNAGKSGKAKPVGGAGLRPTDAAQAIDPKQVVGKVQEHMLAIDKNFWRDGASLSSSLAEYNSLWQQIRKSLAPSPAEDLRSAARATLRTREAASLLATARWINASALERKETRGLHRRIDYPNLDISQTHHLISGGVDEVWVKVKPVDPTAEFPDKEKFFPDSAVQHAPLEKIA